MKNTTLITGAYGGLSKCFARIHAEEGHDLIKENDCKSTGKAEIKKGSCDEDNQQIPRAC